jgi:hypothetical protein
MGAKEKKKAQLYELLPDGTKNVIAEVEPCSLESFEEKRSTSGGSSGRLESYKEFFGMDENTLQVIEELPDGTMNWVGYLFLDKSEKAKLESQEK